jgi:hypothetical protein
MNQQQFWRKIFKILKPNRSEITQSQWEKLLPYQTDPNLAIQLIIKTVSKDYSYLTEQTQLNFPKINPKFSLNINQNIALEMAFSNSPIAIITGLPGTGKTRIATNIIQGATTDQKKVLFLTYHQSNLNSYCQNLDYYLTLSQINDYQTTVINQIKIHHLKQPKFDYLPPHLLPDYELNKLRNPAKLETYLPLIKESTLDQLREILAKDFPDLTPHRLTIFAQKLQQLAPILQQQLSLSQLYQKLSNSSLKQIADQIAIPIIGTIDQWNEHQQLWENKFDLIIIEEAENLTWLDFLLLSSITEKIILFGDIVASLKTYHSQNFPHYNMLEYLVNQIVPNYRYQLQDQFRLNLEIANQIYPALSNSRIATQTTTIPYYFPQLPSRLIWEDIPNQTEGEKIVEFLQQKFTPEEYHLIGIITFSQSQKDWLIQNCPVQVMIKTGSEIIGLEWNIVLIWFPPSFANMTIKEIKLALTRGKDYLIAFGDYDLWRRKYDLIDQLEFARQRMVILQ